MAERGVRMNRTADDKRWAPPHKRALVRCAKILAFAQLAGDLCRSTILGPRAPRPTVWGSDSFAAGVTPHGGVRITPRGTAADIAKHTLLVVARDSETLTKLQ